MKKKIEDPTLTGCDQTPLTPGPKWYAQADLERAEFEIIAFAEQLVELTWANSVASERKRIRKKLVTALQLRDEARERLKFIRDVRAIARTTT